MSSRQAKYIGLLLFWILSAWLIVSSFSIQSQEIELVNGEETLRIVRNQTMIWQLMGVVLTASALFFIHTLWLQQQRVKSVAYSLALLGLSLLFQPIIHYSTPVRYGPIIPLELWAGILVFYYMAALAYSLFNIWQRSEARHQETVLQRNKAELALLRTQLHPHFLFNVLNNLLAMVDQEQQPALAQSIDKLSGLLRYVVYETGADQVALEKELDFIRNYAALQKLRFESGEIDFHMEVQGDYKQQFIEPGIFIPFIENAFKYGVEPEQRSCIQLNINCSQPYTIPFEIGNPVYPALRKLASGGAGLHNVRERLELVYPGKHQLQVKDDGHQFSICLNLNTYESNHR
ncbi:MAG: sensor histidine kinase [Lewinellaceae bacterium]|nr:sensor histidine kinase [Lewinellaceae bacterium]